MTRPRLRRPHQAQPVVAEHPTALDQKLDELAGLVVAVLGEQPRRQRVGLDRPDLDDLRLLDAWVTAAVRCAPPANRPTTAERDSCRPFLERELALLTETRVIVALGGFGMSVVAQLEGLRPRPRFGHGVEVELSGGRTLLGSYHPSQQNTFTGRLTEEMFDAIFTRARELVG